MSVAVCALLYTELSVNIINIKLSLCAIVNTLHTVHGNLVTFHKCSVHFVVHIKMQFIGIPTYSRKTCFVEVKPLNRLYVANTTSVL